MKMSAPNQLRVDHDHVKRLEKNNIQVFRGTEKRYRNIVFWSDKNYNNNIWICRHHPSFQRRGFLFSMRCKPWITKRRDSQVSHRARVWQKCCTTNISTSETMERRIWWTRDCFTISQRIWGISKRSSAQREQVFWWCRGDVLTKEEEEDMYAEYKSVFAIVKKIDEMIAEIDWLESRDWYLIK